MKTGMSRKAKAAMAVALALLLSVPQGISTETQPVVTGHSTFYNGDTYDQCLASIAGILRSRVLWFNDQVLVEHYGGKGHFIYATEAGAPDPTKEVYLYSEGVFFDFVDPNGAHWHIEELYIQHDWEGRQKFPDPSQVVQGNVSAQVGLGQTRWYVWVVELSSRPIVDQFAPAYGEDYHHDVYNFLLLIDTCKFNPAGTTIPHSGMEGGHPAGEGAHEHEEHDAWLWTGTRPNIVTGGVSSEAGSWTANWASDPESSQQVARHQANQTR